MNITVSDSQIFDNQRTADRIPTFLEGQLLVRNGKSVECIVWDITDKGAKIGIDHEIALPLYFDLYISSKKLMLHCEGRWRTTEFVGVRFRRAEVQPASLPRQNPV